MATLLSPAFGDLLRRHRVAAGLTQEELAEHAGLSVRAISDLERGAKHVPRKGTLQMLLDALDLSREERAALEVAARRFGGSVLTEQGRTPFSSLLTAQTTSFFGREHELAAVTALLESPDVRLLTLTGPGGIGKTRLALQAAVSVLDTFQDGVSLASLASVRAPELVVPAIAESLGVREAGEQPLSETLKNFLRGQQRLLVLDNFEHLQAAHSVVAEILDACPEVKVLVTSRAVLHLTREHLFDVPPLPAPDPGHLMDLEKVRQYDAVRLFCERARAVKTDFELTQENAGPIVAICHRLDGLPLAIELAAARIRVLSPPMLLAQLRGSLSLLTSGALDMPERHQTLRGAIEWSYTLLEEDERKLFSRLAVFAGGCTLEAADAVCNHDGALSRHILDGLSSLVDKSLVTVQEPRSPAEWTGPRFGMLETIREYARETMTATEEGKVLPRWHTDFFLRAVDEAEPRLLGPEQVEWLARLDADLDNLRVALARALATGEPAIGLRVAAGLWRYWLARGLLTEGRRWLEDFLVIAARHPTDRRALRLLEAKARIWAAALAMDQGDYGRAVVLSEEGLALSRRLSDGCGIALSLNVLGNVAHYQGDNERALARFEEGLALFRDLGNTWGVALALNNVGLVSRSQENSERAAAAFEQSVAMQRRLGDIWSLAIVLDNLGELWQQQGDCGRAAALHEESLALRRELGDVRGIADSLSALALVAQHQDQGARAASLYREGLALYRKVGDTWRIAVCLEGLAVAAHMEGQAADAARLFGAASALREAIGHPLPVSERGEYDRDVTSVRDALGDEAFSAAWAAGRVMSPEEVGRETLKGLH
jgi:predicted ATPase